MYRKKGFTYEEALSMAKKQVGEINDKCNMEKKNDT